MKTPRSRFFEHALRGPVRLGKAGKAAPGEEVVDQEPARRYFYERLLQVSLENSYNNGSANRCPDFSIRPTSSSATLMASLGLLFRQEETGFSVLYDERRRASLEQYLRRSGWENAEAGPETAPGAWAS